MNKQYIILSTDDYYNQIDEILTQDTYSVFYIRETEPIIHVSCKIGTIEHIKTLIEKGASINEQIFFGNTLHSALIFKRPDIAFYLIDHGVEFDAKDLQGITPLIHACFHGYDDIVDTLINKGAEINVKVSYGKTPLNSSLENSNNSVVKKLIEKGAFINGDDTTYGEIPLTICLQKNNKEMYEYLINKGANPDYRSHQGYGKTANELKKLWHVNW